MKRFMVITILRLVCVVGLTRPITVFADTASASISQPHQKPNIVFILTDDQPFDMFQFMDRYPGLKTPNMDKLAEQGMVMDNFFAPIPLCSPSRATFLTGTHGYVNGIDTNYWTKKVDPDWNKTPSFPMYLQKAGYATAFVGKFHMAHLTGAAQPRPGFDYWLSFPGQGEYFNPHLNQNGHSFVKKGYITDLLTNYALKWLRHGRPKDKPFCLLLWHKAVHAPRLCAPRDQNLYQNVRIPPPPYHTYQDTFEGKPAWQRERLRGKKGWGKPVPKSIMPKKPWNPHYKPAVKMMKTLNDVDESLGRILTELKKEGVAKNTIVIYSSDNGYFLGEHRFHDKRLAYEASMRIPLIVRWPGVIKAGSHCEKMCLNLDVAETLLNAVGLPIPKQMQGRSMLPLWKGKNIPWRHDFLYAYYRDIHYPWAGPTMTAVRTPRYLYVKPQPSKDMSELYDLANDPGEMNNLINNPQYSEQLQTLKQNMKYLKKRNHYRSDRDWRLHQIQQERKEIK